MACICMLKVSIITVTRNNAAGLENTLRSIEALESADSFEWIIIDGHSTDNTDALVAENRERIDLFAKDEGSGIYGAMNQGVSLATGEYIIFMNAGDCFAGSKVVSKIVPQLQHSIVYGRAFHEDGSEQFAYDKARKPWQGMPFGHQSVFVRKELLLNHPFDQSFRISADFDFLLWAISSKIEMFHTSVEVAQIEGGGVSAVSVIPRVRESYRAARRYYLLDLGMHLYYLRKLKWAFAATYGRSARRHYTKREL